MKGKKEKGSPRRGARLRRRNARPSRELVRSET